MQANQIRVFGAPIQLVEAEIQIAQGAAHGNIGQAHVNAATKRFVAEAAAHGFQGFMDRRESLVMERQQADGSHIEMRAFPIANDWTVMSYLDTTVRREQQQALEAER